MKDAEDDCVGGRTVAVAHAENDIAGDTVADRESEFPVDEDAHADAVVLAAPVALLCGDIEKSAVIDGVQDELGDTVGERVLIVAVALNVVKGVCVFEMLPVLVRVVGGDGDDVDVVECVGVVSGDDDVVAVLEPTDDVDCEADEENVGTGETVVVPVSETRGEREGDGVVDKTGVPDESRLADGVALTVNELVLVDDTTGDAV